MIALIAVWRMAANISSLVACRPLDDLERDRVVVVLMPVLPRSMCRLP